MPKSDLEAAHEAIASFEHLSDVQVRAQVLIATIMASSDPIVDVHELFSHYNTLYFRSFLLPRVELLWSSRLTLCAGICELLSNPDDGNKRTRIRIKLSSALLKYRPRDDVINTLLHESIHAYLFVTTSFRHSRASAEDPDDDTGHGKGFQLIAHAINDHGKYGISVFHTFHDEVDSYRTHIWQCDGSCAMKPPDFGLVKRAMNRPPGKNDLWWKKHQEECGGVFAKISEPGLSKAQVARMSGLERAGQQKSKLDNWLTKDASTSSQRKDSPSDAGAKRERSSSDESRETTKRVREVVSCPICLEDTSADAINEHLDLNHPP